MEAIRLFKAAREYLTPVLTESQFHERGMLTPEEFVRAGDHLVRTCPSWQWESGDNANIRPYLPADKQFLITKGVPSYRRVSALNDSKLVEEAVKGGIGSKNEEDWCVTVLQEAVRTNLDDEELIDAKDFETDTVSDNAKAGQTNPAPTAATVDTATKKAGDDYADLEDESLALDDAATMSPSSSTAAGGNNDGLVRSRRYDVSITYDNYYRTPRIWLFGFSESGSPLSHHEVFQVS